VEVDGDPTNLALATGYASTRGAGLPY
jgi:hypothetical protein